MRERLQIGLPLQAAVSQRLDLGDGCWLELFANWLEREEATLADRLSRELPWVQELYFRGRSIVPAPRLTSFHGDPNCVHTYSGIVYEPAAFAEPLLELRARLRSSTGQDFNSVLANLYRDGRDSVGFHADNEPELGPSRDDIAIASISLGAPRRFVLKHRKDGRRLSYELGGGSLLVMRGRTQQCWVHSVPKTSRAVGARINLTYRVITPRA